MVPALAFCAEVNRSWDVLIQSVQPGRTVVVTRTNLVNVEGKLLAISADSITVRWHGDSTVVQRADVYRVRIANIRRMHTLAGMAIGMGGGALIGAIAVKTERGPVAFGFGLMGLGIGAATGGALPIGPPLYQVEKPPKRPVKQASKE